MKVVKKLTALMLSALFIFGSFAVFCFATETETAAEYEADSAKTYLNTLTEFVSRYDDGSFDFSSSGEIETCRLIVKTKANNELPDDCDAIEIIEGLRSVYILQYSDYKSAENALSFYQSQSYIEYAEMDMYVEIDACATATENTDLTASENDLIWGTLAIQSDVLNADIINRNLVDENDEVVVAVFDSGLTSDHGHFDSDRIEEGYNLLKEGGDTSDSESNGHGTHVAGIIYDNTVSNIKIKPYKIIKKLANKDLELTYSILGAAIESAVIFGDDVINMSMDLGASSIYVEDAINYAYNNNVPIIVAAGNDDEGIGCDVSGCYPASDEKVITVAAVDKDLDPVRIDKDNLWSDSDSAFSSNFGAEVDIAAPGYRIHSTTSDVASFGYLSGTSQAAPYVTSAVATLKLLYPDITCDTIKNLLKYYAEANTSADWLEKYSSAYGAEKNYGSGVLSCKDLSSLEKLDSPKFKVNEDGKLEITASEGATIYYTTNGTIPVIGMSNIYTSPISTAGIYKVRAIAHENGKIPSDYSLYSLRVIIDHSMNYKKTVTFDELKMPSKTEIIGCYSSNEEVVTVDKHTREIYSTGIGEAKVTVFYDNGQKYTINVEVKYSPLQWFLIICCFGFMWFI